MCLVDDIEVIFYETDVETGKKTWEAGGVFAPTDVHRQVLFSDSISEHNLMAEWHSLQVSADRRILKPSTGCYMDQLGFDWFIEQKNQLNVK